MPKQRAPRRPTRSEANDLSAQLSLGIVQDEELSQVLLNAFGLGSGPKPNEITVGRQNEPPALKLIYTSNRLRLKRIEAGPGLQAGDIERLREQIRIELLSSNQIIGREVLSAQYPVNGYFKSVPDAAPVAPFEADSGLTNYFQIVPVPLSAPRPTSPEWGGHPLLIEFQFTASSNGFIRHKRYERKADELALLLHVLCEGNIVRMPHQNKTQWVFTNAIEAPLTAKYLQEGYHYDTFNRQGEEYSSVSGLPPIEQIDSQVYFTDRGLHFERSLRLSNSTVDLVNRYFSLSQQKRECFLRAAFWLRHATEARSRSTMLLNLVCCIDALIPPSSGSRCAECRQMTGSLTDKFVAFLDEMVPDDEPEARSLRRELCRIRGDLAHGRSLFSSDRQRMLVFSAQSNNEWLNLMYAFSVAKLVLINWLLRQHRT